MSQPGGLEAAPQDIPLYGTPPVSPGASVTPVAAVGAGGANGRPVVWIRLALLLCCAGVLGVMVTLGERVSDLSSLQTAVGSGQVREITIRGDGLTDDQSAGTQEVLWSTGRIDRVTTVQLNSDDSQTSSSRPDVITERDAGEYLAKLMPASSQALVVRRDYFGYSFSEFGGWRTPSQVGPILILIWLATVALLIAGPAPWRATRWGWFWPMATLPWVAVPAFLLFSGPGLGLRAPRPGRRGLTGGWSFLLFCIVLGSADG